MPCYEVNLISVEFQGKSIDILRKMGASVHNKIAYVDGTEINLEKGTIEAVSQDQVNFVKRKYSIETVKQMAKKKMWQSKVQGTKITLSKW